MTESESLNRHLYGHKPRPEVAIQSLPLGRRGHLEYLSPPCLLGLLTLENPLKSDVLFDNNSGQGRRWSVETQTTVAPTPLSL